MSSKRKVIDDEDDGADSVPSPVAAATSSNKKKPKPKPQPKPKLNLFHNPAVKQILSRQSKSRRRNSSTAASSVPFGGHATKPAAAPPRLPRQAENPPLDLAGAPKKSSTKKRSSNKKSKKATHPKKRRQSSTAASLESTGSLPPLPPIQPELFAAAAGVKPDPPIAEASRAVKFKPEAEAAVEMESVKKPSAASTEPLIMKPLVDAVVEDDVEEVFGAQEIVYDYRADKDVFYTEVQARGYHTGKGKPYKKFLKKATAKISKKIEEGAKKIEWYFETLKIVKDLRRDGVRFLCWNDALNGYYDLGDKRVISQTQRVVELALERGYGGGEDEEEEEDVVEEKSDDDLLYDVDDAGNMLDPDGNLLYRSGEVAPDQQSMPSQEEVFELNDDVDNNETAMGMLQRLKQHVAGNEQKGNYLDQTQESGLGLTPVDGEKASAERAADMLTEYSAMVQLAGSYCNDDEKYSSLYSISGGSNEAYLAALLLSKTQQTGKYHSRTSTTSKTHRQAVYDELHSNVQKLVAQKNLKKQEGGVANRFLSGHVYHHLPLNSMRPDRTGGEPIQIQVSDLEYLEEETIVYPHAKAKDSLPHLMAPDKVGSVMPLCVSGESVCVNTKKGGSWSKTRICKYDKPARNKDFIVGYACTMCNQESIRKVFTAQAVKRSADGKLMEYINNVAARGLHFLPTKGAIPLKNGRPNIGLVGSHSWITTGFCSCDGKFYCFNCWPLHVEQKWNEGNPGREVDVKSSHEYQIDANIKNEPGCVGNNCELKARNKKCSCQPDLIRCCEECYVDHCVDHLKKAIDNITNTKGNLKNDDDYPDRVEEV